jgi:hypothetical protein
MGTRKYHCRQKGCPNTYTDVLGGDAAFGKNYGGGDCMPCYFAAQIVEYGLTPEQVEKSELGAMMKPFLEKTGWIWGDVEDSYQRKPVVM